MPTAVGREHFLFLEIRDRDFNAFYYDVVRAISGRPPLKPAHLTVRGPYRSPLSASEVAKWSGAMKHAVLEIRGLGRFSNPGEEVVFLSVDSPHLRDIWWKPDYPIEEYGFNPHLSLYRGPDRRLADRLVGFSLLHELRFLCAEFALVPFVKKHTAQQEMLFELDRAPDHSRFIAAERMSPGFFEELQGVVEG